jgi:hypothetical protein
MSETVERRTLSLAEFVALWDDDDPWAVPARVWHGRIAEKGLPEQAYLLIQPEMRMLNVKTVLSIPPKRRRRADTQLPKRLAAVVRFERLKQGTTLRGLSRGSRIDAAKLCRFEAGRADITIADLEGIARALGLAPSLLLEKARMRALPSDGWEDDDDY